MRDRLPVGFCMVKHGKPPVFDETVGRRKKPSLITGRGCIFSGKVVSKYPTEKRHLEKQSEKRRIGRCNCQIPNGVILVEYN